MACSICGREDHTKRTHDRVFRPAVDATYWSQEGWRPRRRAAVVTDRSRAERIALVGPARRATLAQVMQELVRAEERLQNVSRLEQWIGYLRDAAERRRGTYRSRALDRVIDGLLGITEDEEEVDDAP